MEILATTPTNHLWKPPIMETPYHLMETPNHLMETPNHLWKPFLKNKELPFMETIFEKQRITIYGNHF